MTTQLLAHSVAEPAMPKGLVFGDAGAIDRFDREVLGRLMVGDVRRIKIWRPDGTIVYSDETRLIGQRFTLDREQRAVLSGGVTESDLSSLGRRENEFEHEEDGLLEVYTRIESPEGQPLLFEAYYSVASVRARTAEVLTPFRRVTVGALLALLVLGVPLLGVLTLRLTRASRARERLMQRAVESSEAERRRIARDLHDGVVQELAGTAFALSGRARDPSLPPELRRELAGSDQALRGSLRQLRSLLVEIHPPGLDAAGLGAALEDLTAQATSAGLTAEVRVEGVEGVEEHVVTLVWRVAQEAIRNALRHAHASQLAVEVRGDEREVRADRARRRRRLRSRSAGGQRLLTVCAGCRAWSRTAVDGADPVGSGLGDHGGDDGADGAEGADVSDTIRVVIVDDHAMLRAGLEQLLAAEPDLEVVGKASDGREAVEVVHEQRPDVVLMDLQMPGMDGVAATREIVGEQLADVLVLTSYSDAERIVGALDAGALGYLLKDADAEEVLQGIRAVARGESPINARAARELLGARRTATPAAELTPRELEVLGLVREGLANKQIARRLGISERTVKAHLTSVFQRIGVVDRTQAALWAERHVPR
ncbi:MAG: response regulator [Nocardioides sp.]